ncbi:Detected protein of confused Function [Hibiscus syriacus]|uniref:Detected protein of confused Function n=1 Tax=Hibiscus syriacus TaxID=106335 RepID=A0A6A3B710_HIBSY|nr:Detected protein of confused Function [Hibiscus syriacus]
MSGAKRLVTMRSPAWQETYAYRPGLTLLDPGNGMEFPPGGLPDIFGLLGRQHEISWSVFIVDGDLGPQEAVVYPGLALYQATADESTGHGVEAQFQIPVLVDDFMQRSHPTDQLFNRNTFPSVNFPTAQDGSMKPLMRRRKNNTSCKPLPPSKITARGSTSAQGKDSPCANIRMEIGWPHGVPFVHPHDLPNKAKIVSFLQSSLRSFVHDSLVLEDLSWGVMHDMSFSAEMFVSGSEFYWNGQFSPNATPPYISAEII